MQGQLFTQDFLTRGVLDTPAHQALSDSALAAFTDALQRIFKGLDSASTINEAMTEQLVINKVRGFWGGKRRPPLPPRPGDSGGQALAAPARPGRRPGRV